MTAFEICRQRPQLELAPVLRIVRYLGLDSHDLGEGDVAQIERLHPHFCNDPELIVGIDRIAERAGLEPETVRRILQERRREMPFLGTAARPMVPEVTLELLRQAAAEASSDGGTDRVAAGGGNGHASTVDAAALHRRLNQLESEISSALAQVRSLSRTLSKVSGETPIRAAGPRPRRHRRSGGGRPDTIVEACRKVLADATAPMKVAAITERVLSQGVEINAKNPNVTISSILSSYEAFERVRRGYYTLAVGYLPD